MGTEKKILIVGSGGFLANELRNRLIVNNQKVALATSNPKSENIQNLNSIYLNQSVFRVIREIYILKPTEIVYCSSKYINDSIKEVFYVNFLLPLLISIYSRVSKSKFIYIGTYWQLFPRLSIKFMNRYTLSKLFLSMLLRILNYGSNNRINVLIICDNFGIGDKRDKLIPYLLKCETNKVASIISTPNNFICLVPIDFVVESILNILNYSDRFCYYCINESSVRVSDLQKIIHEIYLCKNIDLINEVSMGKFFVNTERVFQIDRKFTSKIAVVPELIKTIHQFRG